jgi:tyrosyl-tRNA synthetase
LLSKKQTIYCGFDATADSLHVGNLLVLIAIIQLYRCGHRVIVLVGDSTAQIGDPSGKEYDRPFIEKDLVNNYAISIENSIKRIFRNHENYFWKTKGRNDRPGELL